MHSLNWIIFDIMKFLAIHIYMCIPKTIFINFFLKKNQQLSITQFRIKINLSFLQKKNLFKIFCKKVRISSNLE